MMQNGTTVEAITLAKQRWAQLWPFDIADETWERLFREHRAGDILQSIKQTRQCRSKQPRLIFDSLTYWLQSMECARDERTNPSWPPPDVTRY
jgi:hypothetical protein